jgi:ribonuclease J
MGAGEHRTLEVGEGDLVILASSLIPGNEQAVFRSINNLSRRGCTVVHKGVAHVHVSGHASAEELVLFHNIVEPENVVPVHGEHRHLRAHADIATDTGCLPEKVFICEDGNSVLLENGVVTRGEGVATSHVYIDGLLDDVGPALLRDRRRIGEDGICVAIVTIDTHRRQVAGETVITQKGVVFQEQAEDILEAARKAVDVELEGLPRSRFEDVAAIQRHVVQALGRFCKSETGRRPFILPVVQDI